MVSSSSLALFIGLIAFGVVESFVPSLSRIRTTDASPERIITNQSPCDDKHILVGRQRRHQTPLAASLSSNYFAVLDDWYTRSISIKCPFFRRRAADTIDGLAEIGQFLLVRHKSLYTPPGCRDVLSTKKNLHLSREELLSTIEHDWKVESDKGYYITGRLNTTIYRNDCLFSGPDPDMPVRGLRKYLGAASHLFDSQKSNAKLSSIGVEDGTIVAKWKLEGVLMLPWRPEVPPWTGTTRYHLDEKGLVYHHEETWDKSVLQAFVTTVWPTLGKRIWNGDKDAF